MNKSIHDKNIKYFVSFAESMLADSEQDPQNKSLLLNLAEGYLKTLITFYENEKINCIEGFIYQKLGWIKYYQENYHIAEKHFLYSIINLKNCSICVQELTDSYWGIVNVYVKKHNLKLAKKYFLTFYTLANAQSTITIENDIEKMILTLNLSVEDLLRNKDEKL